MMTTTPAPTLLNFPRRNLRYIILGLQLLVLLAIAITIGPKYIEVQARGPFKPTPISIEQIATMTTLPPLPQQRYVTIEASNIIDTGEGTIYSTYRRGVLRSRSMSRLILIPAGTKHLLVQEQSVELPEPSVKRSELSTNLQPESQIKQFTGILYEPVSNIKTIKPLLPFMLQDGAVPPDPEKFNAEIGLVIAVIFLFFAGRTAYRIKKLGPAL